MSKYDAIPADVKQYYNEQLEKHKIRMVPGHYPVLTTKEQVDMFIKMTTRSFDDYFSEGYEGEEDDD